MARLTAAERAELPDSAFAYVDSRGTRRLPLHDGSHVRNALARFNQVRFESDEARQRARRRLLRAARRHGIVPVGFIEAELDTASEASRPGRLVIELGRVETSAGLEAELRRTLGDPELALLRWSKPEGTYVGCDGVPVPLPGDDTSRVVTFLQGTGRPLVAVVHARDVLASAEITEAVLAAIHLVAGKELLDEVDDMGVATDGLPEGDVTFLLTDIEGSTALLRALGDGYATVLDDVRRIIRDAVLGAAGRQVEARADEFVAVFERPAAAIGAAVRMQRDLTSHEPSTEPGPRVRVGVHAGPILLTEAGYVGITVHAAARIMSAAHGGQILVSAGTTAAAGDVDGVSYRSRGRHLLRGLPDEHELLQVVADGLRADFPPPST